MQRLEDFDSDTALRIYIAELLVYNAGLETGKKADKSLILSLP